MSISSKEKIAELSEILQNGGKVQRVLLLDNFYKRVDIEATEAKTLENLLLPVISGDDSYLQRAAIIIWGELALARKLTNKNKILGVLEDVLTSTTSPLSLSAAIKYYVLVADYYPGGLIERLKLLSDNDHGDVSSQALYSLGFISLATAAGTGGASNLITFLQEAQTYFSESSKVSENRVDALFNEYIIDFTLSFVAGDVSSALAFLREANRLFLVRQMYEFEATYLEFDYLVCEIFNRLEKILINVSRAREFKWIQYKEELNGLIRINRQIEKLKNTNSKDCNVYDKIYHCVVTESLDILYATSFARDKKRIALVAEEGDNSALVAFSNKLLTLLPDDSKPDDMGLLAAIVAAYGKEKGLEVYAAIKEDPVKIVQVITSLPARNNLGASSFITGTIHGQETYMYLKQEITNKLPAYSEEKMIVFFNIMEEIIRYVYMSRAGSSKDDFLFLFSKKEGGKGKDAKEKDLQDHLFNNLKHTRLAYGFEHEKAKFVDGGRVDIVFKTDAVTIPIELKKTTGNNTLASIESDYIGQAQTYASGYDQLGIFILLDLSGTAASISLNFKDLFHIHHLQPSTGLPVHHPDYIISVIIPGNKSLPHKKSKYD